LENKWCRLVAGWVAFLSPNPKCQCQSSCIEGNSSESARTELNRSWPITLFAWETGVKPLYATCSTAQPSEIVPSTTTQLQ